MLAVPFTHAAPLPSPRSGRSLNSRLLEGSHQHVQPYGLGHLDHLPVEKQNYCPLIAGKVAHLAKAAISRNLAILGILTRQTPGPGPVRLLGGPNAQHRLGSPQRPLANTGIAST